MTGFFEKANNINEENRNIAVTENGALGYRSTGKSLLDLNFSVPKLRSMGPYDIIHNYWIPAYDENEELAMRWLFFLRDVREGLGERRSFRIIMDWMATNHPNKIRKLIYTYGKIDIGELIPYYGRWDDLIELTNNEYVSKAAYRAIDNQFNQDLLNKSLGHPISLLAKWLPSLTTSKETNRKARKLCKKLGLLETEYRKSLSSLRKYLNVTEVKMSDRHWDEIEYDKVPSRASMIYRHAFLRHDEERYSNFIDRVNKGEVKINSSTLYPHEIVNKIKHDVFDYEEGANVLEGLWKNLPNKIDESFSTIVVRDGSGSMNCKVDKKSSVAAMDVADALSIYFAERLTGEFHNKIITFSERPKFIEFDEVKHNSLYKKIEYLEDFDEIANTNVEAVFDLILQTAVKFKMDQSEIPKNILIISDMEFDECAETNAHNLSYGYQDVMKYRLFDVIKKKYEDHGYKLPRIVFWNVNSRSGAIPMVENELGVSLVSGFSINIVEMIMSGKTDPYECLLDKICSSRYDPISNILGYN